jgi:hypothetical protein
MGAESKWAYDRIAEYCDGWLPRNGRVDLREGLESLRAACDRAERDFSEIQLSLFGAQNDEANCSAAIELGFQRLIFMLPPAPAHKVLPLLDTYAALAEKLG